MHELILFFVGSAISRAALNRFLAYWKRRQWVTLVRNNEQMRVKGWPKSKLDQGLEILREEGWTVKP